MSADREAYYILLLAHHITLTLHVDFWKHALPIAARVVRRANDARGYAYYAVRRRR